MPFFLKTCLKLRRKNKKGKKRKDIETFNDVATHVTNREIWQQYASSSETTLNEEATENKGSVRRIASFHIAPKPDHLSINENSDIDTNEINSSNAPTGGTSKCKKPDVKCHVAIIESRNNMDIKDEKNCKQLSKHNEVISPFISPENNENRENDIKLIKEVYEETPASGDLFNSKMSAEKSCKIISDIIVTSNVFRAIEELKKCEVSNSHTDNNILNSKGGDKEVDADITNRTEDYLEDKTDNFVSKDNSSSASNIVKTDNEIDQIYCESTSTGFKLTDPACVEKKCSQNDMFTHNANSQLIEDNYCITSHEGSKINSEHETNGNNENRTDKICCENLDNSDSVSDIDMSDVSSKSEYKSLESLNEAQCEVVSLENLLKSIDINVESACEDYKNALKLQFVSEDRNSEGAYSKSEPSQFPVKDSCNLTDENDLSTDYSGNDKEIMKISDYFSHKFTESDISEPVDSPDCKITTSKIFKDINSSDEFKVSYEDNEKKTELISSDEETDTDIPTILKETIEFVNKDYDNKRMSVSDVNRMASDLKYTTDGSNNNCITDKIESIGSKYITNNERHNHSKTVDNNLESPHQSILPQHATEFSRYFDNEYSLRCVHNHSKEVPETDIYTSEDEYYFDDSSENFVLEDSENEREENLYNTCSLNETPEISRKSLFEESSLCQKKNSNLICFHEDFPLNNGEVCCQKVTDMKNDYVRHGKDNVRNLEAHKFEKKTDNSMKTTSNEYITEIDAKCLMSNEVPNSKSSSASYTQKNTLSFNEVNNAVDGNAQTSDKYLHLQMNHDEKFLNKYRLPSPSRSSELLVSENINNANRKKSGSFITSACGDNKIINEGLCGCNHFSETTHETLRNENVVPLNMKSKTATQNEHKVPNSQNLFSELNGNMLTLQKMLNLRSNKNFKSVPSSTLENVCSNATVELDNIFENKTYLPKFPLNTEMLKDDFRLEDLNEIEHCLKQAIERFKRKKIIALSVMNPDYLRNIPIKKVHDYKLHCCKVESFSVAEHNKGKESSVRQKPNHVEKELHELFRFPIRQGKNYNNTKFTLYEKKVAAKDDNHEACSPNSELSSDNSEKMDPEIKQILDISRALRSPKYPFKGKKKATNNAVLYRTRPVIIKPSKLNLVAYVTKGENNVYQIRKGYRICSPVSRKCNISSGRNNNGADFTKNQSQRTVNHRATSPDNLRIKFDDQFRKYASRGRPNGELMSYKRSTEWLKEAGLIGKGLTTEEANDAFKCVAGVKVALNKGDYRTFLQKLTRLKKLNYNDIYEKLCSTANKYADG